MTFEEKFGKLSEKLRKADTSKLTESFAIQVNMTDEDCGGTFYIANIDDKFSVEPYDYRDHTAMLTAAADDIAKVFAGRLNLDNAIASGRFTVEGNPEHIRIAVSAFPKPVRKTAAKKATVVKKEKPVRKKAEPIQKKTEKAKKTDKKDK